MNLEWKSAHKCGTSYRVVVTTLYSIKENGWYRSLRFITSPYLSRAFIQKFVVAATNPLESRNMLCHISSNLTKSGWGTHPCTTTSGVSLQHPTIVTLTCRKHGRQLVHLHISHNAHKYGTLAAACCEKATHLQLRTFVWNLVVHPSGAKYSFQVYYAKYSVLNS